MTGVLEEGAHIFSGVCACVCGSIARYVTMWQKMCTNNVLAIYYAMLLFANWGNAVFTQGYGILKA